MSIAHIIKRYTNVLFTIRYEEITSVSPRRYSVHVSASLFASPSLERGRAGQTAKLLDTITDKLVGRELARNNEQPPERKLTRKHNGLATRQINTRY